MENTMPSHPIPSPDGHGPVEVDVELLTFVERYATNPVRWDLLLYFGLNPDAQESAHSIAGQVRRSVSTTVKELDDLTYLRVLRRRYTPERITYQLARRAGVRRVVTHLAGRVRRHEPA